MRMHSGSYASLSVCLAICDTRAKVTGPKIISATVQLRVIKFGQNINVDDLKVYLEGQGHRSKVKVTRLKNVISCLI